MNIILFLHIIQEFIELMCHPFVLKYETIIDDNIDIEMGTDDDDLDIPLCECNLCYCTRKIGFYLVPKCLDKIYRKKIN